MRGAERAEARAALWRAWWRTRAPLLALALLLALAGLGTAFLPLAPNPFSPPPLTTKLFGTAVSLINPDWALTPQERNAFARLPVVHTDLIDVAISADGRVALAVGDGGTILRSEGGGAWAPMPSGATADLTGVALSADGRVALAVGFGGTILRSEGGGAWAPMTSGTPEHLSGVALSADGRVALAVGLRGTILRSEAGGAWAPMSSDTTANLGGVALSADGRVALAVGRGGTILHSEGGGAWAPMTSGAPSNLRSVALSADGRVALAVGLGATILRSEGGGAWAPMASGTTAGFEDVALSADGRVALAVGLGATILRSEGGGAWAPMPSGTPSNLRSVALSADGRVALAVGLGATILRSEAGGAWAPMTFGPIETLYGVALSADGRVGLAVGWRGTILRSEGGGAWAPMPSGTASDLGGVALSADGRVALAVGERGTILRSEAGGEWAPMPSGTTPFHLGVALSADGRVALAVGWGSTILRSEGGGAWAPMTSGAPSFLSGVALSADGRVALAVGDRGTILRSEAGGAWAPMPSGTPSDLSGVALSADGRVALAVGDRGTILRSEGGGPWAPMAAGTRERLNGVALSAGGRVALAVGRGGTILRSEPGGAWEPMTSGTAAILTDVALSADGRVALAVGRGGTFLRSVDGGLTWERPAHARLPAPLGWALVLLAAVVAVAGLTRVVPSRDGTSLAEMYASDRPLGEQDVDATADPADLSRGTDALARRIAAFLHNPRTTPPLTIAITGAWGTGKSSVLNRLTRELRDRRLRPVWFNAWHHQKEEHIFAALLQAVRQKAVPRLFSLSGLIVRGRLFWHRVCAAWTWWLAGAAFLAFAAGILLQSDWPRPEAAWAAFLRLLHADGGADAAAGGSEIGTILKGLSPFIPLLVALQRVWSAFSNRLKAAGLDPGKLLASVSAAASQRDLGAQLAFRARFQEALKEVTDALDDRTLTLIIDDLDRCRPDQVMEVLEAVNFLVSSSDCFVVLGVDRERVLHAVGLAYERMAIEEAKQKGEEISDAEARRRFAVRYLEKLINIEVEVPAFAEADAKRLTAAAQRAAEASEPGLRPVLLSILRAALVVLPLAGAGIAGSAIAPWLERTLAPQQPGESQPGATPTPAPAPSPPAVGAVQPEPGGPFTRAEPALVFEPREPARLPAWWVWVVFLLPVLLLSAWAALRTWRQKLADADTPAFTQALAIWAHAAFAAGGTPREMKRFLNRLRFVATGLPREEHALAVALATFSQMSPVVLDKSKSLVGALYLIQQDKRQGMPERWGLAMAAFNAHKAAFPDQTCGEAEIARFRSLWSSVAAR